MCLQLHMHLIIFLIGPWLSWHESSTQAYYAWSWILGRSNGRLGTLIQLILIHYHPFSLVIDGHRMLQCCLLVYQSAYVCFSLFIGDKPYYYHPRTRETVWVRPPNMRIVKQEEFEANPALSFNPEMVPPGKVVCLKITHGRKLGTLFYAAIIWWNYLDLALAAPGTRGDPPFGAQMPNVRMPPPDFPGMASMKRK